MTMRLTKGCLGSWARAVAQNNAKSTVAKPQLHTVRCPRGRFTTAVQYLNTIMFLRSSKPCLQRLSRVLVVVSLVLVSSYCTRPENQTTNQRLTPDETYLVDTFVKISQTRDLYELNPFKSDSLFAVLDSTVDTLRIARTMRHLEADPDRWALVFQSITDKTAGTSPGQGEGQGQEQKKPPPSE